LTKLAPPFVFTDRAAPGSCRFGRHVSREVIGDAPGDAPINRLHCPRVFAHVGGGSDFRHAPGHEVGADAIRYFETLAAFVAWPPIT
jgi:hypothetical protein